MGQYLFSIRNKNRENNNKETAEKRKNCAENINCVNL